MKQLRFAIRLVIAFATKYHLAVGLGLAMGTASFIVAPQVLARLPHSRPTLTTARVGRFSTSDIPLDIQGKLSIGLTVVTPDGQAGPGLAESWTTTDDGKTYVFNLNQGVKWLDGSAVKSSHIDYRFRDAILEPVGDNQLLIKLQEPFSPLPVAVSRPVFKSGLLGTGPYRVSRLRKNGEIIEELTLTPADKKSRLPRLKYLFYTSEQQVRTALKLGLAQSIEDIQDQADLAAWPGIEVNSVVHSDRYVAVFFNTQDPQLVGMEGKNLRQALSYAVDKNRWPHRASGPIAPSSWAWWPGLKRYDYDLERARQLLAKAGKPSSLVLATVAPFLPVAEAVKSDWEVLGIPTQVLVSADIPASFSAVLVAQQIPVDPDQYNLWHSTQPTNLTGFRHPRIDKLLEDGRKTADQAKRQAIYHDFQKFLVEEVPAIFLFHPTSYTLIRKQP